MVVVVAAAAKRRGRAAGARRTTSKTGRRRSASSNGNGNGSDEEGSEIEAPSGSDADDAHLLPSYKPPVLLGKAESCVPPTSILQRRAAAAPSDDQTAAVTHNSDEEEEQGGEAGADRKEEREDEMHVNNTTTTNYINSSLFQPLLKYLPRNISLDPSNLRRLLGSVHPSAFGAYRTKEAWRKENPDVLYSAYAARRGESCPPPLHSPTSGESSVLHSPDCLVGASSPPPGYSEPHSPPDVFNLDDYRRPYPDPAPEEEDQEDDHILDWEAEEAEMARRGRSCDISPVGSVSSLAELGREALAAAEEAGKNPVAEVEGPPSRLAVYLSKPPEEQSADTTSETLAPAPHIRPSLMASRSSQRSFSPALSSSGASHSSSPGPVPMRPGVINRSLLTRQRSSSSLATSSSVCTCASNASNASRTSSIRFAPLPDADELKRLRGGRKNEKSFTMGIAGRKNLLLGKTGPDADLALAEGEEFDDFGFDDLDEAPGNSRGSESGDPDREDASSDSEVDEFDGSRTRRHKRPDSNGDAAIRINEDGELVEKRPLGVTLEDLHLPMKRTKHSRGRLRSAVDGATAASQLAARAVSSSPALSHTDSQAQSSPQPFTSSEPLSPSATLAGASHSLGGPSHSNPLESRAGMATNPSSPSKASSSSSPDIGGATGPGSPRQDEKTPMQTPYYERHDLDFTPMPTPRSRSPVKALRPLSTAMLATPPLPREVQSQSIRVEPELAHDGDPDGSSLSESNPNSPLDHDDDQDFESDVSDDNGGSSDNASRAPSVRSRNPAKPRTAAGRPSRKAAIPTTRRASGVKRATSASRVRTAGTA